MIVLAGNRLREGTVTTSATAAGFGKERLSDGMRGLLCKANAAGDFDIDVVLGAAAPVSGLGLANQNATGNIEVYADTALAIGSTLIATIAAAGADVLLATFAQVTETKYRIRAKGFGAPFQAGEASLRVRVLTRNPQLSKAGRDTVYNVVNDPAPAGGVWSAFKGPSKASLPYGWTALPTVDLAALRTAAEDCRGGTDAIFLVDAEAAARFAKWVLAETGLRPKAIGDGDYELDTLFEDALL